MTKEDNNMAQLKVGYRAVFYSGEKKISIGAVRETYELAEQEIQDANKTYEVFKYTPWTHAKVEKLHYRH